MKNLEISTEKTVAARQYGKEKDYWLDKLSGDLVKSCFPYDYQARERDELAMEALEFRLKDELFAPLMKIGTGRDHRVHMILLAVLTLLLERYTGYNDIIVGVPIYKQESGGGGEFINTVLALRNQVPGDGKMSFKELLLSIRRSMIEAVENQNYPIETLVYQLNLPEFDREFPLFDVVMLLENIHDKTYIDHIHCNLVFSFLRTDESIAGKVEFNPLRYKKSTVERIIGHFTYLLGGALFDIDVRLDRFSIISATEKQRVLAEFNNTAVDYPREKTIHEIFREQAGTTPDRIAVLGMGLCPGGRSGGENIQLTYNELNKKSHRLAHLLQAKGVQPGTIVGLMAEASVEMAVGLLGILKSGAAYLPIDPLYPLERKKGMLKDANVKTLLTNCEDESSIGGIDDGIEIFRFKAAAVYRDDDSIDIEKQGRWSSAAYIIYTSGSTGIPRGVMVEHRNVVRLVKNTNYIDFNHDERILQTGALEFDASTFEIWGALLNSLTLYLEDKEKVLAPGRLQEAIKKYHITTIWMTSPLFNHMVQTGVEVFAGLNYLLVGGDVLSPVNINSVRARFPGLYVINGYGPTENTTFSTTFSIDKAYESGIPIGSPIANSTAYILDKYSNLQPVNVPGELCVGGDGVARGYLNHPGLTAKKFVISHSSLVNNKLPKITNDRLYKTGDLARWLPGGNIEFLGRIDHQVKIRGFRVELGEIESRLAKHPEISEVVVLAREDEQGEKYLCAYFVTGKELTVSQLRGYSSEGLPDYMIPAYFVPLEQLPCTPNGKIDRKALPDPKSIIYTGKTYESPANETEEKILQTWSGVLGLDSQKIGTGDDFFELGGNSINILKIQSRLNKQFKRDISLSFMFLYPTIRELAANIHKEPSINKLEHIVKLNKGGSEKNIFIFHPLHGMTYSYKDLAKLLGDHYNVYGIQGKGLVYEEPLPESYDEMLEDYIPQIKAIQKKGPYILAGYCIGAVLAYEAARILEDEGLSIEKLVILDFRAFIPEAVVPFYRLKKGLYHTLDLILDFLKKNKKKNSPGKSHRDQLLLKEDGLKQRIEAHNKIVSSRYRYRRIINSPILHIRAQENQQPGLAKKHWIKMTTGKVDCFETPGDHDTMLAKPHVERLAEIFKTSI